MVSYLESHELFDVSIRAVAMPEYDEEKDDWLNDYDRAYGSI